MKKITVQQVLQLLVTVLLLSGISAELSAQNFGRILYGIVFLDEEDNCTYDGQEIGLAGWTVNATETTTGTMFEANTNSNGWYDLFLLEEGEYLLEATPPAQFSSSSCVSSFLIEVEGDTLVIDTLTELNNFPINSLSTDCPHYTYVDIGGWQMRRCFENTFDVTYCNFGLEDEEDVYIEVELDDSLSLVSSEIPFSSQVGNTYTFDIGFLESGTCGTFSITALLECGVELGATHCLEAKIFPDTICSPVDPLWSGASLQVDGACNGSEVEFTITNVGDGNMEEPVDYIVVEDHVIMLQGDSQIPALASGQSFVVTRDANGATYRLEVDQIEFHPGNSLQESATVETCTEGSVFTVGFVTQFSQNDNEPFVSILCLENRGAYDPNEKNAYPKGFGDSHYLEPNIGLDYIIHFQNTGTDTAFTVVIEDQLSPYLNPSTVRAGASSHSYTHALAADGKLVFTFDNIMLPDSNTNEAASHGYVKFKVDQQRDLPLGTEIFNEAAIFFDFNEAIITNQTFHKINEDFLEIVITSVNTQLIGANIKVGPNPFREKAVLYLDGLEYDNYQLNLFDLQGKLIRTETFRSNTHVINRNHLQNGIYLFQLQAEGQWIASGKLMVQ